ncbi:hypothetical protein [Microlunatus sp. Gsoil 973]|uniref:hypothetical protein n=1 Tax=Microlunatus sp. Gsoil 973 TaxID=2672569 RepID=UPI0012B4C3F4|nr:hypothetical protein [Microlunatus sp. Gsoil 973]QGN33941.1 hypothetical protein GJV80_15215 [Microlunatus sp. Gsoil 973]
MALSDQMLYEMLDALNSGSMPVIGQHDWTKPLRTMDLEARLVVMDDGERAVRLTGLVDQDDWDSAGPIGGMSFTAMEKIGHAEGLHPDREPISLSADHGWFDDDAIAQASTIMSQVVPVDGNRLLQFTAMELVRVVIEISYNTLVLLGPNLASSAIWDGLKYLLTHRKTRDGCEHAPSRIEISTDLGSGKVVGIIDTADPKIARAGLRTYRKAVDTAGRVAGGRKVIIWKPEDQDGVWSELEPPRE